MFTGTHELTVDDKGRLAVPARFRQVLADSHGGMQVTITKLHLACLEIYPAPVFRNVVEQIERMADRRKAEQINRAFVGNAVDTEIDKQGRILLPPRLRAAAELGTDVLAIGQNRRIEIWTESNWNKAGASQDELATAVESLTR